MSGEWGATALGSSTSLTPHAPLLRRPHSASGQRKREQRRPPSTSASWRSCSRPLR